MSRLYNWKIRHINRYRSILVPSPLQWLLVPCLLHQWGCAWYHHCIFSPQHDFPPIVEGRCWGSDVFVLCLGVIRSFIYHSFSVCSCLYLCLAQLTEQRKWTGEDFHVNVMFQSKSVYSWKKLLYIFECQKWWPITRNLNSAFNPSKCTHTPWKHTHTYREHTPGAVGSQCCGARGAVGGSVPCSRATQSWYWRWRESAGYSLPPPTIAAGPETRTRDFRVSIH